MASSDNAAHPIQTLLQETIRLEAAIACCMAKATPKAVHQLRTAIRHVEAQLELMNQLPGLPPFDKESRVLKEHLKKLRQLAGRVRDSDIQRKLIAAYPVPRAIEDSRELRRWLKARRHSQAASLVRTLRKVHAKVGRAIYRLLEIVKPADRLVLTATQLGSMVQVWFRVHRHPDTTPIELHATRKAAKLARYMAEVGTGARVAQRIAKDCETIQEAGGRWHDWVDS